MLGKVYTTNKVMGKLWWMARPFISSGITCLVVCTPTYLYSRSKNDAITCTSHAHTSMSVTHQLKTLFTFALQYDAYASAEKSIGILMLKNISKGIIIINRSVRFVILNYALCALCTIYTATCPDFEQRILTPFFLAFHPRGDFRFTYDYYTFSYAKIGSNIPFT